MELQNKVLTLIFLCILKVQANVLNGRVVPFNEEDAEELLNKTATECGVPNDIIETLYEFNLNDTALKQLKCPVGCIMKNLGWATENNEFDLNGYENFINLLPESWLDELDSDSKWEFCEYDDFTEKCAKLKADNECDLGWEFVHCLNNFCQLKDDGSPEQSKGD